MTILIMKSIDVSDEDDLIDDTKNFKLRTKKLGYSNEKNQGYDSISFDLE